MSFVEITAVSLEQNLGLLEMTLADMSDADLMARPTAGANHPAWQLGHLINSESRMIGAAGGTPAALPAGFGEKFTKETTGVDDPAKFVGKAELLQLFRQVRAATIAWVRSLREVDLAKPCPESMRSYAPTLADLVLMVGAHVMMHLGQIQVLRRKLNKPILF